MAPAQQIIKTNMANIIGFAGTYYTGWQVTEEDCPLGNGRTYKVVHYVYCKNLSKDPSVARTKWGTDEINMDLRGSRSFDIVKDTEVYPKDVFPFGRHRGEYYTVADESYLAWYYNEEYDTERKENVKNILINTYGWVADGEDIYSPEDWNAHLVELEKQKAAEELLHGDKPIEITFTRNLSEYGEYHDMETDMWIKFNNFKEMYYDGWLYGLPLDKKGKAKRIKNKTIRILSWEPAENMCIVKDWEFIK